MDNTPLLCPSCHQAVRPEWYFCPNCGKELNPKPVKVSVPAQIGIYVLSIFLPPLGLWPGVKYLEKPGREAKIVGTVAVILTIISTAATIWLTMRYLQNSIGTYNGLLNTNINGLNGL